MWPFSSYPTVSAEELGRSDKSFDYIIVGGGTAGCCLAARLSEDPSVTVLVIDRGIVGDDWVSKVPLISANFYRSGAPAAEWPTQPMQHAKGRVVHAVLGEGLGGGSRINSCLYTRGTGDYNLWSDMGHPSWSYEHVEPYFVKSEKTLSQPGSKFRGTSGPWVNQTFPEPAFDCLTHVVQASKHIGIPTVSDLNSPTSPVVCCSVLDVAIDASMHRMSTFQAFLSQRVAAARKPNLTICAETIVTRVRFSGPADAISAPGVYYEATKLTRTTRNYYVKANREIILCAGAIASPQLLMLSGVGPRSHLQEHSINIVRDMPGVGSTLKDHASLPVMYQVPLDDSLHVLKNKPIRAISELLRYLITGKGLFSVPFMQWSIFVKSSLLNTDSEIIASDPSTLDPTQPGNTPDIEVMPVPHRCTEGEKGDWDDVGVFSLLTCLVKPKSVGTVRLAYTDPRERALIDLGYLSNNDDILVLRKAVRLALRLAKQMGSQGYPLQDLQVPASDSDVDVDEYIRSNIRTSYHYSSTCRMAAENDERPGVVDDDLKVHGIKGLRICDTSIFPEIVSTHTMAPVVMVAEKCADLIKATWKDLV